MDGSAVLMLENVHVVNTRDGVVEWAQDVLIAGDVIRAVGPTGSLSPDDRATRPDVSGAFVLPMLVDLHAHIFDRRDLEMYASLGIGTVRNMDGWPWHASLNVSGSDDVWSAQLVTTGPQYGGQTIDPLDLEPLTVRSDEAGPAWIKLYDDVGVDVLNGLRDVVDTDVRITGHLPDRIPLSDVLDADVYDDVAHAEEMLYAIKAMGGEWRDHLDQVAARMVATRTAVVSTLVMNESIGRQRRMFDTELNRPEVRFAPPLLQVVWGSDLNQYRVTHATGSDGDRLHELSALVGGLWARGVMVLPGTDAPNPMVVPGFSLLRELELLVGAGIPPADVVRSATREALHYLGGDERPIGVVQGAAANLLVIGENPLVDVSHLRTRVGVVMEGEFRTDAALAQRREAVATIYAAERGVLESFDPQSAAQLLGRLRRGGTPALSSEALESTVWAYREVGNHNEALTMAEYLAQTYPSESSTAVLRFVREEATAPTQAPGTAMPHNGGGH